MITQHARYAPKERATQMRENNIDQSHDIQVDGKSNSIVMIFANAKGRRIVETLWPDIRWTTDEIFASAHGLDWLFTSIRVTKLPPSIEAITPLAFASGDPLGAAVAAILQRHAEPRRVASYCGSGNDLTLLRFDGTALIKPGEDEALSAEYVPPGN